jgi:gas vesicle protein
MALGSSAKEDELKVYKKITGIGPFLDEHTSRDEVSNSKPDPDIFRLAQRKLGIEPESIIAIGDTPYDAESAGKAGMRTIGVLCGGSDPAKLRAAGCIALYRDPEDLLENFDASPLADGRRNQEKSMANNGTVCFLTGLGLGAIIGLVYAPISGSETRDYLRSKSDEGQKLANAAMRDAAERVRQGAEKVAETTVEGVEAARSNVQGVSSAVEAAKKGYREARKSGEVESAI